MFAEIAIPNTTLDILTYSVPDKLTFSIRPGSLVKIELKKKICFGIIVGKSETTQINYAKDILDLVESQFLPDDLMQLLTWTRKYYFANWGAVLNLTIPKNVYKYKQGQNHGDSSINNKVEPINYDMSELPVCFDEESQLALRKIIESFNKQQYKTFLLFNPDNKTVEEIYLHMLKENLRLNRSAIVLVPEIVLTPKFMTRFRECLGENLLCLHSGLKLSERKAVWHKIKNQACSVVLGTRSAVFAPVNNLGLIIVDAEHDLSYKEKERHFHYHARDVAVMRSQQTKAVTVLASATPSCESYYNSKVAKYELIPMPRQERKIKGQVLLIDMRKSKSRIVSPKLQYEIRSAYKKRKPTVLFLNRLGFSRIITCQDCGYTPLCPHCGIPLVLHREGKLLTCHLCQYRAAAFDYCPQCKGNDFLYQGIGTQQVASEIKKIVPRADIKRFDADTMKKSKLKYEHLQANQILISTKLGIRNIDFAQLGVFGVVSADTGLFIPDFRAGEKTFQELSQFINQSAVNKDCKIIIQTYHPDNHAIYLAIQENYLKFYERETVLRKKLQYPPFTRLALISISSAYLAAAQKNINRIEQRLASIPNITVLGPTQIRPYKKQDKYAYQFLIKMQVSQSLSNILSAQDLICEKVNLDINIDPL
jgi:primosomal protein N' (replication factor Y)